MKAEDKTEQIKQARKTLKMIDEGNAFFGNAHLLGMVRHMLEDKRPKISTADLDMLRHFNRLTN